MQPHAPAPQPASRPQPAPIKKKKEKSKFFSFLQRKWWLVLIIIVALALLVAACYFAFKYFGEAGKQGVQGAQTTQDNGQSKELTTQDLINEISKVIVLPAELPEVATISNVDLLKGQDFFKNAQNGDSVLIFKAAGRGLIYRPSEHKIIEYEKITYSGGLPGSK